ncbi:glycosyl hydrolase family 18 protein [Alicyclobacillus fastidiosus]|uniref:Glycosyl hydrolase family 18 protein n=1 Tax=Alicyclobacillus fastidiosus TaxID=392011 RepID=A0ABY6ZED5_9BACL|nr:LysM peptidoglycan-binding domain-containing protein [Alicyclobacillus fastidiosus]WAH41258.1 glycosyl hydrolase family 18 protein [Alicyclobacillus fastidiosus]GMA62853.1 putative sporulation-specific glycosylase YdhD [Alicyclobacillus fastidiosus]
MEIHVVQTGETLFRIAEQYGVSVQSVVQVNQLSSASIVPNQSILIPTNRTSYVVMPGDTLLNIAKRYGLSLNTIRTLNPQVSGNAIEIGSILRFPEIVRSSITVLGFLELTGTDQDRINVLSNAPYNTYIAPFGYGMDQTGAILPANDQIALQSIRQTRTNPAAVFSNWTGEGFNSSAVHAMLSSASMRAQYISEVMNVVTSQGYRAVVIDFENIPPGDSNIFEQFLSELSARLLPSYRRLFVSVMPIRSATDAANPLLRPYDYATLSEHAVHLILMAYNWHWATGEPGPIAAFHNVESTIQYALSVVPRVQVLLGVIRYGYDWVLPYDLNEAATVVSAQDAIDIAMQQGSSIFFDTTSMSPSFRYVDQQGAEHIVWFEDVRSIQVKLQLVKKYNLPGIAQWEISQSFPQFNPLIRNNFQIV